LDAGWCAGAIDILAVMGPYFNERIVGCWRVPEGTRIGQRVKVVIRYVESHPARMHESFVVLAADALKDAWPCAAARRVTLLVGCPTMQPAVRPPEAV
jgi:hypothetical protein